MPDKKDEQQFPRTHKQRVEAFLAAFTQTGSISAAASAAKLSRNLHQRWLKNDPDYARAFDEATRLAGTLCHCDSLQ
jgi:hypothetical protein